MRRVLYVQPVGHDAFTGYFERAFKAICPPVLRVDVTHLGLTEVDHPFVPSSPTYLGEMFRTLERSQEDGYEAAIIGCSSDPGLREARRRLSIPVVGPFSSALHFAALRADRIGVVTPGPISEVQWLRDEARQQGMGHFVEDIVIANVGHPPIDEILALRMKDNPQEVADEILDAHRLSVVPGGTAFLRAEDLVNQKGAGALVFACTFWTGMLDQLSQDLGVPVFDPCGSALHAVAALLNAV